MAASIDVAPDHIEIGSFMALAGVTGGELRIKDTVPGDLRMIRLVFERVGLRSELDGNDVVVPGGQKLVVQADVGEYKSKIQDGPWPAFPADLTRSPSRSRPRPRARSWCTSGCSRTA